MALCIITPETAAPVGVAGYQPWLRFWNPAFKDAFGGPANLTLAQAIIQAGSVELFYTREGNPNPYATGGFVPSMRAVREGAATPKLSLKMLWYQLPGGVDSPTPSSGQHPTNFYHYDQAVVPVGGAAQDNEAAKNNNTVNYLMRTFQADYWAYLVTKYGAGKPASFDGGGPDVMGTVPMFQSPDIVAGTGMHNYTKPADSGVPWVPYTTAQWLSFNLAALAWLRAGLGVQQGNIRVPLMVNGINDGPAYFGTPATALLLTVADVCMSEEWLRGQAALVGTFPPEVPDWQNSIDMGIDAAVGDRGALAFNTSLWPANGAHPQATVADSKQWWGFHHGTAMFAQHNGGHFFHYRHDDAGITGGTWNNSVAEVPGDGSGNDLWGRHHQYIGGGLCNYYSGVDIWADRLNVGFPTDTLANAAAYKLITNLPVGGRYIYRRRFTRGVAVVNPTANACTYSLELAGGPAWRGQDGTPYTNGQAVSIPAHTGLIVSSV